MKLDLTDEGVDELIDISERYYEKHDKTSTVIKIIELIFRIMTVLETQQTGLEKVAIFVANKFWNNNLDNLSDVLLCVNNELAIEGWNQGTNINWRMRCMMALTRNYKDSDKFDILDSFDDFLDSFLNVEMADSEQEAVKKILEEFKIEMIKQISSLS